MNSRASCWFVIVPLVIGVGALGRADARPCSDIDRLLISTPAPPESARSLELHQKQQIAARGDTDFVLVGDSLAEWWNSAEWMKRSLTVSNLGVGGDRTQNVLWRLALPGELSKLRPRKVVLILGTNNLTVGDKPCAIIFSLQKVIERISAVWPKAPITVIEILPRGPGFIDFDKERVEINAALRAMPEIKTVNVDDAITCRRRQPCPNYWSDNLHLSQEGYRLLLDAVLLAR